MLLMSETLEKYGYSYDELSYGSKKPIIVQCDYCNKIYETNKKRRLKANELVDKDACINCKFKKRADISMCKYGVDNISKLESVKNKIRNKNQDRLKSEEYKQQHKKIMLEKYGVESAFQNKDLKEKQKKTMLERYGVEHFAQNKERHKLTTKKMIETKIKRGKIKLYDGKTRPTIAKELGFSRSHFGKMVNKYGYDKAKLMTHYETSLEKMFREWVDTLEIDYQKQFRVENKVADLYFSSHKIIVELDGLYWHCELTTPDYLYHYNKYECYIKNGYYPLFFREDELTNPIKFKIIQSMVLNKLGRSKKLGARKCDILMLDNKKDIEECRKFVNENHLMGVGAGQYFILKYSGQIMSVLCLKRKKEDEYEISRFCSRRDYSITGAFSRLLNFAENRVKMSSLSTFIDRRYGSGNYLPNLGFIKKTNYPSFKWTDGLETFHRMKFPKNTGYDKGLVKLWDCGQVRWTKEYGV